MPSATWKDSIERRPCLACGSQQVMEARFCGQCGKPMPTAVVKSPVAPPPTSGSSPKKSRGFPIGWIAAVLIVAMAAAFFLFRVHVSESPQVAAVESSLPDLPIPSDPSGPGGNAPPPAPVLGKLGAATVDIESIEQQVTEANGGRGMDIRLRVYADGLESGRVITYFRRAKGPAVNTTDPARRNDDGQLAVPVVIEHAGAYPVSVTLYVPYACFGPADVGVELVARPSLYSSSNVELSRGVPTLFVVPR
jgi:hypothetical protein